MIRLSVAIMGHPKRRPFIAALREKLPDAELVLDRHEDRYETGRRALRAFDPDATHHLVIQDDALPCRSFLPGVTKALEAVPEGCPVSLYIGGLTGGNQMAIRSAIARARELESPWLVMEGPWWGVGIIVPTADIGELVSWHAASAVKNYDRRISRFYAERKIPCWYTLPSLVQHRSVSENPSLIADSPNRTGDRRAHWFIGGVRSPLRIDWTREPTQCPSKVLMRNERTGQRTRVVEGSVKHRRLLERADWITA